MQVIDKILSKKNTFLMALGGVMLTLLLTSSEKIHLCTQYDYLCRDKYDMFAAIFFMFFPLFFFSLVTYFLSENVFRSWFRFALWCIPLCTLLVFIVPADDPGTGGNLGFPSPKAIAALLSLAIFSIVSLLLILFTWAKEKDRKAVKK